jgi:RimJ/RimL family protein N-acetyltransferase
VREWRPEDKPALIRHANNRNVWRNLVHTFPHPYTEAAADAWITMAGAPGRDIHRAIVVDGQAIGGVGVNAGTGISERTGLFGYWIGESHWGQGLATAAAGALVADAFSSGQFSRLEASVFSWNPASMRVLDKLGFQREGVLRKSVLKEGQLIDSVLYALVISESQESA